MLSGVQEAAKSIAGTVKAVGQRLLQRIFPMLRKETKETLDGVQDLARSAGADLHGVAGELRDLIKTGGIEITIDTPIVIRIIRKKEGESE